MNGVLAHPAGTSGASSGAGEPASAGKSWRQLNSDFANARGAYANDSVNDQPMVHHQALVKQCGHDIEVGFDWKTFDAQQWSEIQKKLHKPETTVGGMCMDPVIGMLGNACEGTGAFTKPNQRDAARKIKTVTCHYKACAQWPDQHNSQSYYTEYTLSADGTNLDETYCEEAANGDSAVAYWFEHM